MSRFKKIIAGPRSPIRARASFDTKRLANHLDSILVHHLNRMGRTLNDEIQNGLDIGLDIDGKRIEKLSRSTMKIRLREKSGVKPLVKPGTMRKTKLELATKSNLKFIIRMVGKSKRTGKHYGAFHNQGYRNAGPPSWFPGAKVPKRKWFGITKSMKPGGTGFNKVMRLTKTMLSRSWSN